MKKQVMRWEVCRPSNEEAPLEGFPPSYGRLFSTVYDVTDDGLPIVPGMEYEYSFGELFDEVKCLPTRFTEEWFQSYEGFSFLLVDCRENVIILAAALMLDEIEVESEE